MGIPFVSTLIRVVPGTRWWYKPCVLLSIDKAMVPISKANHLPVVDSLPEKEAETHRAPLCIPAEGKAMGFTFILPSMKGFLERLPQGSA